MPYANPDVRRERAAIYSRISYLRKCGRGAEIPALRVELKALRDEVKRRARKRWEQNNAVALREYARDWRKRNHNYVLAFDRERTDKGRHLLHHAKERAAEKGLEFTLTMNDIPIPSHCPVLGVPIAVNRGKQGDDSPSIDRIDNNRGYTSDNVQVISFKANRIKTNATAHEVRLVAEHMARCDWWGMIVEDA